MAEKVHYFSPVVTTYHAVDQSRLELVKWPVVMVNGIILRIQPAYFPVCGSGRLAQTQEPNLVTCPRCRRFLREWHTVPDNENPNQPSEPDKAVGKTP